MTTLSRRQFMATGVAATAAAALPGITLGVPATTVPFVKPSTNILHVGARFGHMYGFSKAEVLQILGASELSTDSADDERYPDRCSPWGIIESFNDHVKESIEAARDLAEAGDNDIYRRGQLLLEVRRQLNWHFNFEPTSLREWLDTPNPHLEGATFRELMIEDIELAAANVNLALTGQQAA